MRNTKSGVSSVGLVSFVVVLIGFSAVGFYLSYSLGGSSTTTGSDTISLQNFVLSPAACNLSGRVYVNSYSQIYEMRLYMNGTFVGAINYSRKRVHDNHDGYLQRRNSVQRFRIHSCELDWFLSRTLFLSSNYKHSALRVRHDRA
jgi:hypothetical protein